MNLIKGACEASSSVPFDCAFRCQKPLETDSLAEDRQSLWKDENIGRQAVGLCTGGQLHI